jgi:hypothetical protein
MSDLLDDLRWVRLFTIDYLPTYLIDQIRDKNYVTEDFLHFQNINLLMKDDKDIKLNPFNHIYALVNPKNIIKGFLWFTVDPLTKDIFIQSYSVDKEYWNKGFAVKKLISKVLEIHENAKLNKIFWATRYPKHSMRYGFKHSKSVLMEYDPKEKEEKLTQ